MAPGTYTEVIRIRVTPDLVDRFDDVIQAMNLRNGGKASISEEGRAALVDRIERLEAEYGPELAIVRSFQSSETAEK